MTASTDTGRVPARRFEVRYAEDGTDAGPWKVLGWHDTKEGGERMAASWRLRPTTTSAWVVDTAVTHGGDGVAPAPPPPDHAPQPPWDDCKVAFGIDDEAALWRKHDQGLLQLPLGWTLTETDGSGARWVAVFRVDGIPTRADGQAVDKLLRRARIIRRQA